MEIYILYIKTYIKIQLSLNFPSILMLILFAILANNIRTLGLRAAFNGGAAQCLVYFPHKPLSAKIAEEFACTDMLIRLVSTIMLCGLFPLDTLNHGQLGLLLASLQFLMELSYLILD